MSEIVKGFVSCLGKWTKGDLALWVARNKDKMHSVPVLLLPDDGTHVVVTREEWERVAACETFARWAYGSLCGGDLDLDMLSVQGKLVGLGLVEERPVNPEENEWGADMLFFWKTDPPSATTPGGESHD